MYYKVFFDTNVYDGAFYSFRNAKFNAIREYVADGTLALQINSIVEGEVKRHIREKIGGKEQEYNKLLSSCVLAGITDNLPEKVKELTWVDASLAEFEQLLSDCRAERIPISGTDVDGIFSDYFNRRYPFEEAKKDEFPDAFIIQSILQEITRLSEPNGDHKKPCEQKHLVFKDYKYPDGSTDDLMYCVVSADAGFREAIESATSERIGEDVKVFEYFSGLLRFLSIQTQKGKELQEIVDSGEIDDIIIDTIDSALRTSEIELLGAEIAGIEKYDNLRFIPTVIGSQTYEDGATVARVYIDYAVDALIEYTYINEELSHWDAETQDYLWTVMSHGEGLFTVKSDLTFSLTIFEDEMEFIDYLELPDAIYVFAEDLIELISCEE